jgi:hypothetical protein
VLIGLDLTRYQVLSVSPDTNVVFGAQNGTFIKGIAWNSPVGTSFSFTIRVSLAFGPQAAASPLDTSLVSCTFPNRISSLI